MQAVSLSLCDVGASWLFFGLAVTGGCTPTDLAGTFHCPGVKEASNLTIRRDGSFSVDWDGCDSSGVDEGRVVATGGGFVFVGVGRESDYFPLLVPEEAEFQGELFAEVDWDGNVVITVGGVSETWIAGRVCSMCELDGNVQVSRGVRECECFTGSGNVPGVPACE